MERAGVVKHPVEWSFSGYNEIQHPKRKNGLIHYEKLMELWPPFGLALRTNWIENRDLWDIPDPNQGIEFFPIKEGGQADDDG